MHGVYASSHNSLGRAASDTGARRARARALARRAALLAPDKDGASKNCKHSSDLRCLPEPGPPPPARSFMSGAGHERARSRSAAAPIAIAAAPGPRGAPAEDGGQTRAFRMAQRDGGRDDALRPRECSPATLPLAATRAERRTADGTFRNLGWARGDRNNPRCGGVARVPRHSGRGTDTHGLAARSGSAAPASMARPGPGRGRAPGRRAVGRATQHSPISLGTRRETLSHHLDDTAHRPRRF